MSYPEYSDFTHRYNCVTHLLDREYQLTMTASIKDTSPSDISHKQ